VIRRIPAADVHPVEAGQLGGRGVEAGAESVYLTGPAVRTGFVNTVAQVGDDLDEAWSSLWVDSKAGAPDACFSALVKDLEQYAPLMVVVARGVIGGWRGCRVQSERAADWSGSETD
jgi:hypothetical protein